MMRRQRREPVTVPGPVAKPPGPPDGIEAPYALRFAAAWSWRLLLVIAAIWVLLELFSRLSVVLVPVIIGLLFAAAASPAADRLERWGIPRGVATVIVVLTGIALIAALVTLVAQQFSSGFDDLRDQFDQSLASWSATWRTSA